MDSEKDHSLDTLLDLNGEIFPMNNEEPSRHH